MGTKFDNVKKESKSILQRIVSKMTPNGALIFSAIITAIVLVLFLATSLGRSIIVVVGYVIFIAAILYGGYNLYKFSVENAKGIPKQKSKAANEHQITMEEVVEEKHDDVDAPKDNEDFSIEDLK